MKIYIVTSSETGVGIFEETITLDWKSIDTEFLNSIAFTDIHQVSTTQRKFLRETIGSAFEDITSYPATVRFEDEKL